MKPRVAVVAGASGLVGGQLLQRLLASSDYATVHSLVRRVPARATPHSKLREHVVSFEALPELPLCDDVYVALGTTLKLAGSQAAFRRVDYDCVVAVARAGFAAGAQRLALVSALGADAQSRVFYNRVKGEAENALAALGYARVVIARPSLLIGDRLALGQPARPGEVWATRLLGPLQHLVPATLRPVHARDVAASLVRAVLADGSGAIVVHSRDMHGAASG